MQLISSKDLFSDLRQHHQALPAFNVYDLETIKAVFAVSKELDSPAFLAFGERYLQYASFHEVAALVEACAKNFDSPVVLHLDHCGKLENIKDAVKAGFKSVMFDGSSLPFADNIQKTKEAVDFAHDNGVAVEGELGYLNDEASNVPSEISSEYYTSVSQACEYAEKTGIDSLAVSVGNVHGLYKGTPHLDFLRLKELGEAVTIPLVLHGCSGISMQSLAKAIELAVVKINVNTEIAIAASSAIRSFLEESGNKTPVRYEKLLSVAFPAMVNAMKPFVNVCRNPKNYL